MESIQKNNTALLTKTADEIVEKILNDTKQPEECEEAETSSVSRMSKGRVKSDSLIVNYNQIDEGFSERKRRHIDIDSSA